MQALLLCALILTAADEKYLAWSSAPAATAKPAGGVGQRLTSEELAAIERQKPVLPFTSPTVGMRDPAGGVWLGSRHGVMYLAKDAARWRLFHSRRWLPGDEVTDLVVVSPSEVWVSSREGAVTLARRESTLEAKMNRIDATLVEHHVREGLVGGIGLKEPGRLDAGHMQYSSDNDGLWTSIYVAAEAFRYSVTRDPVAKQNARRSLEALMFLERVTGIPGFAARSIVPIDQEQQTQRGEWHRSADGRWWWKGDTSSDEIDGHYFAYSIYYDVAADEPERAEIRAYVARITNHILDHGLYYVGPSGEPTLWGVWAPERLNHDLRRVGDRGLNSLEILSHLKVAEHIVGDPRYRQKIDELIEKHSYATNTVMQKNAWPPDHVNHSDDELAFLAYYPLLKYERDPQLRKIYLASIKRSWTSERLEASPFYDLIYGAALQASSWSDPGARPDQAYVEPQEYDREVCLDWFREVPEDTTSWTVNNSERQDIGPISKNRHGRFRSDTLLPVQERHVMRWNGDPYELDGGSAGRYRDDGAAILLPYWLGRYHRLID